MSGDADGECPDGRAAATGDFCLTEEQAEALELDHNVAITAGAGTGKTTALTERYLHILESDPDIGPEEIVTITFTNDAANELQDRIRDAVDARLSDAETEQYERWRTVKDDLDDGYIHTIHGFCARLLREHVVDAPVSPEFEVYDETDAAVLARDVVRDELDERIEREAPDVRRLAHLWRRDTLEDILVGLLQQRPESEVWAARWADASPADYVDYVWESIHPISPADADALFDRQDVRDALESILELESVGVLTDVSPADDTGADTIATVTNLLDEFEPLDADATPRARQRFLDALCEYLTTNDGTRDGRDWMYWGSSSRWSDAGREDEQDQLESAVETLFAAIDPETLEFGMAAEPASAHYVLALARLFERMRGAFEDAKSQQNVLDYDDLVETTISFLEDTPTVRTQLLEQFAFVMVDEVQDTDPRQWELVRLLTSRDVNAFDAQNVCLVGDEKQSIYRFRGADVTSFGEARRALEAANPEDADTERELSGNFRTVEETLQVCNELFDGNRLFAPLGDDYEPFEARPQALTAAREDGLELAGRCEYFLVPDADIEDLHGPGYLEATPAFTETGEREAYALAARLTRLFADPPEVYDEDADEIRSAEPEDVTILLRSRTRLKAYERALDAYDVPYTVISGTGYYDTPEITALLNLLRVLEDPSDEVALYGVLRSPLFGFPDDDLAQLRLEADDLWASLETAADGDEHPAIADAYDCLQRWRRLAGTHPEVSADTATPWGTLCSQIIDETGFLASVAGDERPRQAAVNINRFREQLRRWEEAGIKTIAELRARLELRQDLETHAPEATIPEDLDGVQIRTLHSAKGLEFPIVVVPELGTQFNFGTSVDDNGKVLFDELDLDDGDNREPVIGVKSPTPEDAFASEDTIARRVVRDRVRQHERAELKRQLYVALTRARDHLLLSGVHEIESEGDEFELAEPNEPADAICWRDWLQPLLIDADTTLEKLTKSDSVTETLGDSEYRIQRPCPPVDDWETEVETDEPSLRIDIPDPGTYQRVRVISATEYAAQRTGADESDYEDQSGGSTSASERGLSPTTLGTIVHRICETRLDRSEWEQYARAVAERLGETPSDDDLRRIETHADRALEFLVEHNDGLDLTSTHEELSVTARFEGAHVVGDIDHLGVSSEAFHVVDFKTGSVNGAAESGPDERYWPQLEAYAVGLHQSDPDRRVELALYFTEAAESHTREYEPEELDELEATMAAHVGNQ